jgi:hypothetical protein
MAGYTEFKIWAKKPGGSWFAVSDEAATSRAKAIAKFRSFEGHRFPKGTKFQAKKRSDPEWIFNNPRRVRRNSTTLHNLASVKITRNRDGTVGIVARRNGPKKRNR